MYLIILFVLLLITYSYVYNSNTEHFFELKADNIRRNSSRYMERNPKYYLTPCLYNTQNKLICDPKIENAHGVVRVPTSYSWNLRDYYTDDPLVIPKDQARLIGDYVYYYF